MEKYIIATFREVLAVDTVAADADFFSQLKVIDAPVMETRMKQWNFSVNDHRGVFYQKELV